MFPSDSTYYGIPYSSVKEKDKFVGHEVSFYTFLTAAQNPRSVLYSENVGRSPYQGVNCATYYGTVCSMTVNYVLGLDAPYQSNMYPDLPFIEMVKQQDTDGVRIGDILGRSGHVVLIEDIKYNADGSIASIYILESLGSDTKIKRYTPATLMKRWVDSAWTLYRYLDFGRIAQQEQYPFLSSLDPDNYSVDFSGMICTSRGDRVSYREGENVVLNLLRPFRGEVQILRNGQMYQTASFQSDDFVLTGLPSGSYEAVVVDGDVVSSTFFEVIGTSVNVRQSKKGMWVSFNSANGVPEYVSLCSSTGSRLRIHVITDAERASGELWLASVSHDDYVKVFFRGDYGRISNDPIRLK